MKTPRNIDETIYPIEMANHHNDLLLILYFSGVSLSDLTQA